MKTSELTGSALDWAVATCVGKVNELGYDGIAWGFKLDGKLKVLAKGWAASMMWNPSTNWALGGPIIQREKIEWAYWSNDSVDTEFRAKEDERGNYLREEECVVAAPLIEVWTTWIRYGSHKQSGPTPLIAAMRTYVASKLGEVIEVPEGLACLQRLQRLSEETS